MGQCKIVDNHEIHFYQIQAGGLYSPKLFTVQSRNILLLKYAVH